MTNKEKTIEEIKKYTGDRTEKLDLLLQLLCVYAEKEELERIRPVFNIK